MANKPAHQKRTDADMEFAREYEKIADGNAEAKYSGKLAKLQQDIKDKTFTAVSSAKIKIKDADEALNRLQKVVFLRQAKEELKKEGRWAAFCEENGIDIKHADYEIAKIGELKDEALLKFGSAFGYEINKIKYLTFADSQNLEVEALEPEEALALAEDLKEKLKAEREERTKDKKAAERVAKGLHKEIEKKDRRLDDLSTLAGKKGLKPEEHAFISQMETMKVTFDEHYIKHIEPENIMELIPADEKPVTQRMKLAYLTTLDYMAKQLNVALNVATEIYGTPKMLSAEIDE